MEITVWPRREKEKGGILMMPLKKNVPQPKDPKWKLATCPACGRECWERPLPVPFKQSNFEGALCTECALREGMKK